MTAQALCIADASALHEMCRVVDPSNHPALLADLTDCVDKEELGFPREVCSELQVIARDEPIWAWASGLTNKLDRFAANISFIRPFMRHVHGLGFTHGIEHLEKGASCLAPVGRLCLSLTQDGVDFVLATEDTGTVPLRPTMEQIANRANWPVIDAVGALNHLGLGGLIN